MSNKWTVTIKLEEYHRYDELDTKFNEKIQEETNIIKERYDKKLQELSEKEKQINKTKEEVRQEIEEKLLLYLTTYNNPFLHTSNMFDTQNTEEKLFDKLLDIAKDNYKNNLFCKGEVIISEEELNKLKEAKLHFIFCSGICLLMIVWLIFRMINN